MKARIFLAAAALAVGVVATPATVSAAPTTPDQQIELVIFHGQGCPHCAKALTFLGDLQARQPLLHVSAYEVWYNAANRELFASMAAAHGLDPESVPTIFLGDLYWVGWDSSVGTQIEAAVDALVTGLQPEQPDRTSVDVPFVGAVDVGDRSLVVATVLIGFVDGVNPCSFWVLSMLLALVLHSGSRRRILAVGTVFLGVTSALYGLYMFGAYSALDYASDLGWIRVGVALIAGTFGVLHLKEYWTHRGLSLAISERRKPGMYRRMRVLAEPDRSLPVVLAGTAVLAIGVSLAETPCSAGLPLLWTNLLSDRNVPAAGTALLFLLYLLVFLLDELIVFGAAVVALRAVKVQERHGRALQLLSGTLMLALALTMLLAPRLLESVTGTVVVFAVALALVAFVLAMDRASHPQMATAPHPPVRGQQRPRPAR